MKIPNLFSHTVTGACRGADVYPCSTHSWCSSTCPPNPTCPRMVAARARFGSIIDMLLTPLLVKGSQGDV